MRTALGVASPVLPLAALLVTCLPGAAGGEEGASPDRRPGGAATSPRRAPGLAPAPNVDRDRAFDLSVGRSFFATPWVPAPSSTTARDGLGPLFNAQSCASCHPGGGRGALEQRDGEAPTALVLRLGIRGADGQVPEPTYGDQVQTRGIAPAHAEPAGAAVAEGVVHLHFARSEGELHDGARYELLRPEPRIARLAYGPLDVRVRLGLRLPPALHGVGLLEAIDEAAIRAHADPEDRDGDGISGRPNLVLDPQTGALRLGRFGHKAARPSVRSQIAAAFRNDMGITSELFREQPCTRAQRGCNASPSGVDARTGVEIDARLLSAVEDLVRLLAVPARGPRDDAEVRTGRALFSSLGCSACHVPSFVTRAEPGSPFLAGQHVWPYADLLLHDMGPELADALVEGEAAESEWRTAPLWGMGAAPPDARALLHDGRARSVTEAVLWHGGEAEAASRRFAELSREEREMLLAFLESL